MGSDADVQETNGRRSVAGILAEVQSQRAGYLAAMQGHEAETRHLLAKMAAWADVGLSEAVSDESWDYQDADTRQLTHNIHRYSGKFIPQIASRTVSLLTEPGEIVLDPFCGSGTTLLETVLLGRRAIGIDLNPVAVLISKVKTTPIPPVQLTSLAGALRDELSYLMPQDDLPLFGGQVQDNLLSDAVAGDPRSTDEWYVKWFEPRVLQQLLTIDHAVGRIADDRLRRVAVVAFSDILRKSSRAHSGYPNVMFDKAAPSRPAPGPAFFNALNRVCQMVGSLVSVAADLERASVILGSASNMPLSRGSVDAIVTHPPYVGSIPYAEYQMLSLKWLGADPKVLDRSLTGGRRQSSDVVQRFQADYGEMWRESSRVLRPNGRVFAMVGNPVVRGVSVDLGAMSLALAIGEGFRLVAKTTRQGMNRRANKMGTEELLFFRKQSG